VTALQLQLRKDAILDALAAAERQQTGAAKVVAALVALEAAGFQVTRKPTR
jgi:hypothetical protein